MNPLGRLAVPLLSLLLLRGLHSPAAAQSCTKGDFEDDDTCHSGRSLGAGRNDSFCDDADDWMEFNACAGRSYTLETTEVVFPIDTRLELYGSDCTTLLAASEEPPGGSARIDWTAASDGVVHLRVRNLGPTGGNATYRVTLTGDTSPCATWARNYGTTLPEESRAIDSASDGGFFHLSEASGDVVVLKVDRLGNVQWQQQLGGPAIETAAGIRRTSDGGCVFVGTTSSFGSGGSDVWVVKLDGAGNVLWQKAYGTPADERGVAVHPTWGDALFVAAGLFPAGQTAASWMLKLDAAGGILWQKSYDIGGEPTAMHSRYRDEALLAGTRYDVTVTGEPPHANPWILRLDGAGGILWQRRIYTTTGVDDVATAVDDSTLPTLVVHRLPDASATNFVDQFFTTGQWNWSRSVLPGTVLRLGSVAHDGGNLVLFGTADGAGPGGSDVVAVKLDGAGNALWARAYGGTGADLGAAASASAGSGFLVAATTESLRPPANGTDPWLVRIDGSGGVTLPCDVDEPVAASSVPGNRFVATTTAIATPTSAASVNTTAVAFDPGLAGGPCVNADNDRDGVANEIDNCPETSNADQADADADALGDLCDNCPAAANAGQTNTDGDARGDACDPCPRDPVDDADGDGACADVDNCPAIPNPGQGDADADGKGDACDLCPTDPTDDQDGDLVCGLSDNCPSRANPAQRDADLDGRGDFCDVCPTVGDPSQLDTDLDGAGDACECEPRDPNDRRPAEVTLTSVSKSGPENTALNLCWSPVPGADYIAIHRGTLSQLRNGYALSCGGLEHPTTSCVGLSDVPLEGEGYYWLIQGVNDDCGGGPLGYDSQEREIVASPPSGCTRSFSDRRAVAQTTTFGTVVGDLATTHLSDDVLQTITETLSGGNPSSRFSRLSHQWTFDVSGDASILEIHIEGKRAPSTDGDDFRFLWSADGGPPNPIAMPSLPFVDDDIDLVVRIPAGPYGTLTIVVEDTDRTPGNQTLDAVSIDQIFIRALPF